MWITFHQSTEYFFKKSCTQVWIVPNILCFGHFWEIVPTPLSTDNSAGWHQFSWHNWCPARPEWSLSVSDHTGDNLIYQHEKFGTHFEQWFLIIDFFFAAEVRRVRVSGVTGGAWLFSFVFLNTQHILHTQHSTYIVHSTLNTQHILYTVLHRVEYSKGK